MVERGCSSLFCSCCFWGIFALIYPYRIRRPIPDWPSAVTLNAIISVLSVIVRAGLVVAAAEALSQQKWIWLRRKRKLKDISAFDRASRGPGCSLLLLLNPFGWSAMSIPGALLIILTVAIGPFCAAAGSFHKFISQLVYCHRLLPLQVFPNWAHISISAKTEA